MQVGILSRCSCRAAATPRRALCALRTVCETCAGAYHPPGPEGGSAMSQANPIRLFVTHAWENSDDYLRVFEYLESAQQFLLQELQHAGPAPGRGQGSAARGPAPPDRPGRGRHRASEPVRTAQQDLLTFQLLFAQASHKPVVLMKPFGAQRRCPSRSSTSRRSRGVGRAGAGGCDSPPGAARGDRRAGTPSSSSSTKP